LTVNLRRNERRSNTKSLKSLKQRRKKLEQNINIKNKEKRNSLDDDTRRKSNDFEMSNYLRKNQRRRSI